MATSPEKLLAQGQLHGRGLLQEFDRAWQGGAAPRIEDFLTRASAQGAGGRELLEELVKIDLEYRWRDPPRSPAAGAWATARPRLEDYVARHLELGPLKQLSLELIGEEYWVRQRYGDRPIHAEYLSR